MKHRASEPSVPGAAPWGLRADPVPAVRTGSLGLWPRYVTRSSALTHAAVLGYVVDNLPGASVVAVGGRVETAYLALCQVVQLAGSGARCRGFGTWEGGVPPDARWHHDVHYRAFSSLEVLPAGQPLRSVLSGSPDLLLVETEGLEGPGLAAELAEVFQGLHGTGCVVLVDIARHEDVPRVRAAWDQHLDPASMVLVEGVSTLLLGAAGPVPPALDLLVQAVRGEDPAGLADVLAVLARRNTALAEDPSAQARVLADLGDEERLALDRFHRRRLEALRAELGRARAAAVAAPAPGTSQAEAELRRGLEEARQAAAAARRQHFAETETLTRMLETQRVEAARLLASEADAEERRRRAQVLSDALAERSASLGEALARLEEERVRTADVGEQLAASRERERETAARLAEALEQGEQARVRAVTAEKETIRLRRLLTSLRASRSWRLTRPLRWFTEKLTGRAAGSGLG